MAAMSACVMSLLAAPHVAVVNLTAERVVLPALRVRLDDVEMCVEEQRRLRARALDPRDHVGAALLLLEELRREAGGAEMIGDPFGGEPFVPVAFVTRSAVDARYADQIAQELDARVAFGVPVHRHARA